MIEYILTEQVIEALGWTLLHSLWQGALFAILLVLLLIGLRSYTAQSRYVVSVGLLCAFFLTVSVTFSNQFKDAKDRLALWSENPSQQIIQQQTTDIFPLENKIENTSVAGQEIVTKKKETFLITFKNYFAEHLPLLVTIWLLGILFLQLRFLGQLAYVQRLKHYGTQLFPDSWKDKIEELEGKLRIQKKVSYRTSLRIESPMAIGWLKPVVLFPQQLFHSLSETEIYAVLAHELAHIRREDFIVNLMQTFLCNVFFFHPGVWWMSNQIDDEREHCCDDLAVAAIGPATSYAKTLINVSEFQLGMHKNPALSMAFSGKRNKRERGGFTARIKRLFLVKNGAGTFREGFTTACILITALFLGLASTGRSIAPAAPSDTPPKDKKEMVNEKAVEEQVITRENIKSPTTETRIDNQINQPGQNSNIPVTEPVEPAQPAPPISTYQKDDSRIDALIMACREGDLEFVKTLIKSGIEINGIGSRGFTPLMEAVQNDEVAIVEYLIKKGADVNQTQNCWTALIEAADEDAYASMELLLKAGADVNYFCTQGSPTAITMAASEDHLGCLRLLVENGADINGIGKSIPPLHMAAAEGKLEILDYLISQKVDINKKDANGRTALMFGASEGKRTVVKTLVNNGATISIVDLNGYDAKDYAKKEEAYDIVRYLSNQRTYSEGSHSDVYDDESKTSGSHHHSDGHHYDAFEDETDARSGRPAIHQATLDGLIEKVERMVAAGTDINSRDDYGRTPLHIAAAENHNIDMRILIGLGADINAQDQQGRTPMMYAAADGHEGAVSLLVSMQADFEISDVDGMRAYEWARSGGNPDLANFLGLISKKKAWPNNDSKNKARQKDIIKEKTKKNEKEKAQGESMHIDGNGFHLNQYHLKNEIPEFLNIVRNGSVEDCRRLLNQGVSPNSADDTGQSALMVAAMTNRLDIAKLLIERGADVNQSSASGLTALHYTALENHDKMAELLLRYKAQVDPTMRYSSTDGNHSDEKLVWEYIGATPLLIAVESGHAEVLVVLIKNGANLYKSLTRNVYVLDKKSLTYLSGSEVMGLDQDFLEKAKLKNSDKQWTPYKQALQLNEKTILVYFQN